MIRESFQISEELLTNIQNTLEQNPYELYWDYNDELSMDDCKKLLTKPERACHEIDERILNYNLDHNFDQVQDHCIGLLDQYREPLMFELMVFDPEIEWDQDLKREIMEQYSLDSMISIDTRLEDLAGREQIPAVVSMYSNYDCINSNWYETQSGGYSCENSYFGDMVNLLELNPAKLKREMLKQGIPVYGRWVNRPHLEGKEWVDYKSFVSELQESCCGANLLSFAVAFKAASLITQDVSKSITMAKGTSVGLYSSMQGGGSIFNCELIRDVTVELDAPLGEDDYWRLDVEPGYYMKDKVYGVTGDFFTPVK